MLKYRAFIIEIDLVFSRTGKQLMFERTNIRLQYLRKHLTNPSENQMLSATQWANFEDTLKKKLDKIYKKSPGGFADYISMSNSRDSMLDSSSNDTLNGHEVYDSESDNSVVYRIEE